MNVQPGHLLAGRFRIVRFLGEGGASAVYEAVDDVKGQRVAVKLLHHELSQSTEVVTRFEREAEAASRIGSDHIVCVFGAGTAPEGRFIVLEYLEGQTLADRLRGRQILPCEEVASLVIQLLDGLSAAHALGIVHRDLKPANLFLLPAAGGRDFLKILDFGASKLASAGGGLTRTGAMIGTPMYMAPEQMKSSDKVDARTDIYAAGVILYQCSTGKVPFDVKNPVELAFRVVSQDPPPPETHLPTMDPAFSAIIRRAMAREPEDRFQTAAELEAALVEWLRTRRIAWTPPLLASEAPLAKAPSSERRMLLLVAAGLGALVLVIAIAVAFWFAGV